MDVTFSGYVGFTCSHCNKSHSVESSELKFAPDTSAEAEDDEYIRYVSQMKTPCPNCSSKIRIKLDVWEFPEAVVNYSFYDEVGAYDIECEFNVEHYFDDEAVKAEDVQYDLAEVDAVQDEDQSNPDDEDGDYYEPSDADVYLDRYDDDQ